MSEIKKPVKLTKADLLIAHAIGWVGRCWGQSQSRKGGMSFCSEMAYLVNKLYPNNLEKHKEILTRHSDFFMTDYVWGGCIDGVVIAMEEKRANDLYENGESEIAPELISGIKTGLMGPLAGFGDTINQSVVRAATIAYTQPLAAAGNPLGAVIGFIGNDLYRWTGTFLTFWYGYKGGTDFIEKLTSSKIVSKLLIIAGIVAMTIMGGLAAANVKFATNIQLTSMTFDEAIEMMVPGLYQLLPPFFIMWLIKKKKVNTIWIVIGIILLCVVLAYFKIIG